VTVNAAVRLVTVNAVYVMNVEVTDVNVMEIAGIFRNQVHAASRARTGAGIRDFQIIYFPVFLVLE
jgi:hypothetical protein